MWEGVGDRTELQHIDPHSTGHNRVSFPFSWAAQPGAWGPCLSAGCCFLYSSISLTLWYPKTHWIYIIVQHPLRRLWNGMFDRHRAEITVMQFTGHSLPMHQFVTVPWDFNPVPYCQPSSPMPMECTTSAVFGMACLAGSEVNIQQYLPNVLSSFTNRDSLSLYIIHNIRLSNTNNVQTELFEA